MTRLLSVLALLAASIQGASARDVPKAPQTVTVDLDRNGVMDVARVSVTEEGVRLLITLNSGPLPAVDIPADASRQFGICPGSPPALNLVKQSETPLEALGEMPNGYKVCPTCFEIEVRGGDCDPLYFYWDTVAQKLSWWRA